MNKTELHNLEKDLQSAILKAISLGLYDMVIVLSKQADVVKQMQGPDTAPVEVETAHPADNVIALPKTQSQGQVHFEVQKHRNPVDSGVVVFDHTNVGQNEPAAVAAPLASPPAWNPAGPGKPPIPKPDSPLEMVADTGPDNDGINRAEEFVDPFQQEQQTSPPTPESCRAILLLVGVEVPIVDVASWTDGQRTWARQWASEVMTCNDTLAAPPARPAFLGEYGSPSSGGFVVVYCPKDPHDQRLYLKMEGVGRQRRANKYSTLAGASAFGDAHTALNNAAKYLMAPDPGHDDAKVAQFKETDSVRAECPWSHAAWQQ